MAVTQTQVQENSQQISSPNMLEDMLGVGQIQPVLSTVRDLISGKPGDQIDIPDNVKAQLIPMVLQQYGASSVEEFLSNPEIIDKVKTTLREDTLTAEDPTQTMVFQFIDEMDGAQLKTMISESPEIQSFIKGAMEEEIQERVDEAVAKVTINDVIKEGGAPEGSLPEPLSSKLVSELSIEDLKGLSNEELTTVISSLPIETFNATLNQIADTTEIQDSQRLAVAADASFEDKQAAFSGTIALANESIAGSSIMASLASLFTDEEAMHEKIQTGIFDGIRSSFEDDADGNGIMDGQDHIQTIQTAVRERAQQMANEFDITSLSEDEVKQLFTENREIIAHSLTEQENWQKIEAMIPSMMQRNQDKFMEAMMPEMTRQGIGRFQEMFAGLPDGIKGLITGLLEIFTGILEKASGLFNGMGANIMPGLDDVGNMITGNSPTNQSTGI